MAHEGCAGREEEDCRCSCCTCCACSSDGAGVDGVEDVASAADSVFWGGVAAGAVGSEWMLEDKERRHGRRGSSGNEFGFVEVVEVRISVTRTRRAGMRKRDIGAASLVRNTEAGRRKLLGLPVRPEIRVCLLRISW